MKKILIINGHPDKESFNFGLSEAYKNGAITSGADVREIVIRDLQFNPNLQYGYRQRTELEPDLLDAQEKLKWADHMVWIYPIWWGSVPAIMKGFLDRVLLPGYAFKKRENSVWWDQYFSGQSARLICTLDQPQWYYRWYYGRPSYHAIKKLTLNYIGVKKVKTTSFGPLWQSTALQREKWLHQTEELGRQNR